MRALSCGWEHRAPHPQLILTTTWTDQGIGTGGLIYSAGGAHAEGDGYMETQMTGWENAVDKAYVQADYKIMPSREIWLHIDAAESQTASGAISEARTRIGWDSSGNSDPGYFQLNNIANQLSWNWSGSSGTASMTIALNTWYHIKIRVRANAVGNSILQVWVDGVLKFDIAQDISVGFTLIDRLFLYSYCDTGLNENPNPNSWFDNWVVNNTAGASDNSNPGPRCLSRLAVTGAGSYADWARGGVDSGANWSQVDELPPDETEWVESQTSGDIDAYAMENTPAVVAGVTYTPEKVFVRTWAKIASPGAGHEGILLSGGSIPIYSGGSTPIATAYAPYEFRWDSDPAGGAWARAAIDAAEVGIRVA